MIDNKKCILIADDEKEIRDILTLLLNAEGYHVIAAEDGQEAVDKASDDIDLFILDVNMPRLTGIMAAVELRKTYQTPIIFLTAYSGESDKVMGFSAGADDYIVKPFSNVELLLRVKAILRRTGAFCMPEAGKEQADSLQKNRIEIQDIILDLDSQSVIKGGENIALTYTEFKILELLAAHKKKIYSLESIYSSIWDDEAVGDAAIMVHIKNIRKKLGDNSRNPIYIKTAWGRGYYID
ncbi:MAG: response regulator transcription factor [Firmicutes bacterium]|nr:response regulator transcription factor [Bacillota bacterium]MBQ4595356.1 response regulator transcription factor [Bacillota bacterium]MBR1992699.1 response regulator transcription factor [Bacillota bacterium]